MYHGVNNKGIYNALIVSRPCNKILLNCINKIVKNVKNNYYGDNMLSPTGPMLIEEFFNKETKKCIELSLQQIMGTNKIFIKFNNKNLLITLSCSRINLSTILINPSCSYY